MELDTVALGASFQPKTFLTTSTLRSHLQSHVVLDVKILFILDTFILFVIVDIHVLNSYCG